MLAYDSCRRLFASLLMTVVAAATVKSQDTVFVPSGSRIRLRIDPPGEYREATLIRMDRDSLVFRACSDCQLEAAPRTAIAGLDVFRGGSGSRGTHVLIGAALGLGTGWVVGSRTNPGCRGDECEWAVQVNRFGYGFIGLVLGSVAGALVPGEQWERLLPRSLSVVPYGGHVSLQYRLALR